ncbi:hypothetical protein [Paraconexibacter sp. AEG42_29]
MASATRRYFPFVQFEFAHSLGLAAGRYLLQPPPEAPPEQVQAGSEARRRAPEAAMAAGGGAARGAEPARAEREAPAEPPIQRGEGDSRLLGSADVLVIRVRGAKASSGSFLRRGQKDESPDTEREVPLTIATVIRGRHMLREKIQADQFLKAMEPLETERWVRDGLADLNRAVGVYRVCAADPYVFDVSRADPRLVRLGHGFSEEVFAGRWTRAINVEAPKAGRLPRALQLAPSEGVAAVLAGQGITMESEELLLRVLLDLDQRRYRAAAVGLKGALDLLLAELAGQVIGGRVRLLIDEITEVREPIATLAIRACRTEITVPEAKQLAEWAEMMGAAIDRWRYEPRGY